MDAAGSAGPRGAPSAPAPRARVTADAGRAGSRAESFASEPDPTCTHGVPGPRAPWLPRRVQEPCRLTGVKEPGVLPTNRLGSQVPAVASSRRPSPGARARGTGPSLPRGAGDAGGRMRTAAFCCPRPREGGGSVRPRVEGDGTGPSSRKTAPARLGPGRPGPRPAPPTREGSGEAGPVVMAQRPCRPPCLGTSTASCVGGGDGARRLGPPSPTVRRLASWGDRQGRLAELPKARHRDPRPARGSGGSEGKEWETFSLGLFLLGD